MADCMLGMKADRILRDRKEGYVSGAGPFSQWAISYPVSGTVIYVGSGCDLSSLFLFEEADSYIHQDLSDLQMFLPFRILEEHGIISGFNIISDKTSERRYEFRYKEKPKTVVEVFNSKENVDKCIHNGDVALNVHPLAQKGLDAIYFNAVPDINAIKAIQINLLPHLRMGGVFEGSYYSAHFYGAEPDMLGLKSENGTYIKKRHLTADEIERAVGFTIDDYINIELANRVFGRTRPKVREEARKRGAHLR